MNTASNRKLPVIFCVEDNGYAISTPVEVSTPGGNISRLVANFPNFHFAEVDGTDPEASFLRLSSRRRPLPRRPRPGLCPRPLHEGLLPLALRRRQALSHPGRARGRRPARSASSKCATRLLREGILTEAELAALEHSLDHEVAEAAERALAAPLPWSQRSPATSTPKTSTPPAPPLPPSKPPRRTARTAKPAAPSSEPRTMADLINACLHDEMRRDPRIVVFGEDVADASREEALAEVKGKGGVFKLTAGLQTEFGSERVFNSPLAEANIVGRALGYAVRGMKPVVEIQFFDYIWPAMHQIHNELSVLRWRSNGQWACPVVIRAPIGGYLTGGSIYHSQSGESIFTHIPGLRVVFPSNALDANGLLRTAIRCDDPVLFLEHKRLYRETHDRAPYPGPDFAIPFGKARIVRPGSDLTHHHLRRSSPALPASRRARQARAQHRRRNPRPAHAQSL